MQSALGIAPAPKPVVEDQAVDPDAMPAMEQMDNMAPAAPVAGELNGLGLNLRLGQDGTITLGPSREGGRPPAEREDRRGRGRYDEDDRYGGGDDEGGDGGE